MPETPHGERHDGPDRGEPDQPQAILAAVSRPDDLIVLIPHLFGYQITDSIVLLGFDRRTRAVAHAVRSDLPDSAETLITVLTHLRTVLHDALGAGIGGFILVGLGSEDQVNPSANALLALAQLDDIPIGVVLRSSGIRYWRLDCTPVDACPAEARSITPSDTVADLNARLGPQLPTQNERLARLRPRTEEPSAEMDAATERARRWLSTLPEAAIAPRGAELLRDAAARYRTGADHAGAGWAGAEQPVGPLTVEEAARLSVLLDDDDVFDLAVGQLDPDDPAPWCRLWWDMSRRVAAGAHACLTLLALSRYLYGDTLLARAAIDQAVAIDPHFGPAQRTRDKLRYSEPPLVARWQPPGTTGPTTGRGDDPAADVGADERDGDQAG